MLSCSDAVDQAANVRVRGMSRSADGGIFHARGLGALPWEAVVLARVDA